MFSRHHAPWDGSQGVFAVSGLAVVAATAIVVLAATAVGFSLTRKDDVSTPRVAEQDTGPNEGAARADTMSALKNGATAMETWGVENAGVYTGACGGAASTTCTAFDRSAAGGPANRLVEYGLQLPRGVSLEVVRADSKGYCLRATHEDLSPDYAAYYSSQTGTPGTEPCS